MALIESEGVTLYVEVEGDPDRPALLLSNSLGTSLALWDAQMPAFLAHFRVVRYDHRGHGASSVGAGPCSIGDLGRDAVAILDGLGIAKAHVVGISMGGAVAQWMLLHAPQRVERAVLACTAQRIGKPESWNARITTVLRDGMAKPAAATIERWFSPAFVTAAPEQVAVVRQMLVETPAEGYAACCAAIRDADLRRTPARTGVPILVVTGADDPVIAPADTEALLATLPGARHIELPTRHLANVEAAAVFTETIVRFLKAKTPARRTSASRALPATPARAKSGRAKPVRAKPARRTSTARKPTRGTTKARTAATDAKVGKTTKKKKAVPKKVPTTRRPTRSSAARSAVKKETVKAKPAKTRKSATKKQTPPKRFPAPRRKPTKTTRRPSGRRKP